jgi:hypothetical protein
MRSYVKAKERKRNEGKGRKQTATYITNKAVIHLIYKELLQVEKEKNNNVLERWAKNIN